ncbi:CAMK/CAMKL/CHK1 protein kinase [Coprinopsis cinerea okayama7|uniref:non-specific serine/threonine protein kinase n=1 Tax=Coprinopsis cinerea (strain Okayama-7 / 130 / ATCC MYA-4618 / FGSC 9003) TaxID=240176 RepID=A8N043_COPC7|nr:CAMK/CAMKL/CHK1 protein kinase [Coprinopsis cinerea okayama7\|eukprot:XP_001828231.1 CAMK/CAMKL/CHK1 protein kinase [Coprinopsis cinerea okayama7\
MPEFPKVTGYTLVDRIGGGGFSSVYKAIDFKNYRAAACKVIIITEETTDKERKTLDKEMRIHSALKHENVLEFLNAVVVELKHKHAYHPGYYMLMELACGGDLFDKIAPDKGVSDDLAHLYFNQLIAGMDYIHQQGVCHRDLKPENLLLDVAGTLKISDFGLSSVYKLKDSGRTRSLTERCGSLPYVAPEVGGPLNSNAPYEAEPIDVWGCGVILFTLLVGNTPWDEPTRHSPEFCRYLDGTIFDEDPWNRISETPLSLLQGMLNVNPAERMTLSDVYQHPWCLRPSQLARADPGTLAEMLTQGLREDGDLNVAAPDFGEAMDVDEEDDPQRYAGTASQFTQKLMLFSQTQSGPRYVPNLTRFYASAPPTVLMPLIQETLEGMNVKCKLDPRSKMVLLLRIGGYDKRKLKFRGWVNVESFSKHGYEGSFCGMARDEGSPISWRQLWKALIKSPLVSPHVLFK